jgi:hypothetical protein
MSEKSNRAGKKANLGLLILLASSLLSGCVSVNNQNQSQGGNSNLTQGDGNLTQKEITNPPSNLGTTPQPSTAPSANSKPGSELTPKAKSDGGTQPFGVQVPRSSPENIGELQGTRIFEDRLTTEKQKQCYHFNLSNSSNTSFYVDRVTEGASISSKLAVDTNHNGVVDDGENINSITTYGGGSIGSIHELLGADPYSFCVDVKGRNTDYRLQLVNNLSEMKQLTQSAPQSGSLSDTNVQDYYQFTLDSPQSVSLVVSQISEPIEMNLYVDSNTNGAADDSEHDDSFTVYPDPSTVFPISDGEFEKTLSAGAYFVVLKRTKGNTDYNFALSSPIPDIPRPLNP